MHPFNQYEQRLLDAVLEAARRAFAPDGAPIEFGPGDLRLDRPPSPELGQFAFACFPLARILKKSPGQIAEGIASHLEPIEGIEQAAAAGPYVNFRVDPGSFSRLVFSTVLEQGERFAAGARRAGRVMVEYSSPNTNKPLHIGHVRNNCIGMALANLLEFAGFDVVKANLLNDRGVHICKSMVAYEKWGEGRTPESEGVKGDHLVGRFYVMFENELKEERKRSAAARGVDLAAFGKKARQGLSKDQARLNKQEEERFEQEFLASSELMAEAQRLLVAWERGDQEVRALWETMNHWVYAGFLETYRKLGCEFDHWYRESETYDLGKEQIEPGIARGVFYSQEDGSVWAKLDDVEGLADKLVRRADGTSVYITQDIGTAIKKQEDHDLDRSIYVVASEQDLHFANLFAILRKLGFPWAGGLHHASYGMVTLPAGRGRPKSREGTAVDADDLLAEMEARAYEKATEQGFCTPEVAEKTKRAVALAALKVYLLAVSPEKNVTFDPDSQIEFVGDTGVAVQYSAVRIRKIFVEAGGDGAEPADLRLLAAPEEVELARALFDLPRLIERCAGGYTVSPLAGFCLDLTKSFARFYDRCHVKNAPTPELRLARLALCRAVLQVLTTGLAILGIPVPERM